MGLPAILVIFEIVKKFKYIKCIGNQMLVSLSCGFIYRIKFLLQHTAECLFKNKETGKRCRQRIQGTAVVGTLLSDLAQICCRYTALLGRPFEVIGDASLYDIDIYAAHYLAIELV